MCFSNVIFHHKICCRCETEYRIVEDRIYREDCKVDVDHVCEENLSVPQLHYPPIQNHYDHPGYNENHPNNLERPDPQDSAGKPASTSDQEMMSKLLETPTVTRQIRQKRSADNLLRTVSSAAVLKEAVKEVLESMFETNQQLGEVKATIKQGRSVDLVNYHLNLPPDPPLHPVPDLPPVITTKELPAKPGCRSLATKECVKIPVLVPRQVPYSVCRTVPDVECVHVLKKVPELQCTPEVFKECADYEQSIPYLEEDEECEEIIFDQCLEVSSRS